MKSRSVLVCLLVIVLINPVPSLHAQVPGIINYQGRIVERSVFVRGGVFNGQMWVLGGNNGSSALNDVWSLQDAVTLDGFHVFQKR